MSVFGILLAGGVMLFVVFLAILVWAIRSGQMDDLRTPAERAVWDDKQVDPDPTSTKDRRDA
jgi:cbb3-type cytochrome oxidase maturation protein